MSWQPIKKTGTLDFEPKISKENPNLYDIWLAIENFWSAGGALGKDPQCFPFWKLNIACYKQPGEPDHL